MSCGLCHFVIFCLTFAMDGAVRDLAGLRGTYHIIPETRKAVKLILDLLEECGIKEACFLLDKQVSNSGRLLSLIADVHEAGKYSLDFDVCNANSGKSQLFEAPKRRGFKRRHEDRYGWPFCEDLRRYAMDKKTLKFVVFLIHALADEWKKPYRTVYQVLNESRILDSYIVPCYDVLHTQGKQYLVEDITEFVKEKGVAV